jgi:hypothetical protein
VVRVPAGWQHALERDVRASAAYRLWSLESLPDRYRRSLEGLGADPSTIFGFLVADAGSGLPDKVVDAAGAALFSALQHPGRLPPSAHHRLAELVLDGVLEVDSREGFVCGPVAYETLTSEPVALSASRDRLSRLSHAALAYAERLRLPDVHRVASRLYCYHRIPLSQRWIRAYPGPTAVLDLLRGSTLSRHWIALAEGGGTTHWLSWARRDDRRRSRAGQLPYKLYVSPHVDALPDVLPALVEALTAAGASRFKVGADASGLLRPDKIVVYLSDVRKLESVAQAVEAVLDGVPPHGVPFSAELAGDGLLSWGGDPPEDTRPVGGRAESWRLWVCRRLAEHLAAAQVAPLHRTRPHDFALARLALDGVDVRSFAPANLDSPHRREPFRVA